jgi:hypothetical protein
MTKEQWLAENATLIGENAPQQFKNEEGCVAAVLVDNGWMKACGLAFDPYELKVFSNSSDLRPKTWYWIKPEHLEQFQ